MQNGGWGHAKHSALIVSDDGGDLGATSPDRTLSVESAELALPKRADGVGGEDDTDTSRPNQIVRHADHDAASDLRLNDRS